MNRAILIGRLTKDLELRKTPTGTSVLRFTVAVNRRVAAGQEPVADFINCVAWNKTAELMAQYIHKGSQVGLEGRIQTGSYEKDGTRVYTTEVICDSVQFLDPKASSTREVSPVNESQNNNNDDESFNMGGYDASSDDLPF